MVAEICFDGYLESVVENCHKALRLYTLMDDCEESQPDFFELKMQVVQPQPENKKISEQEADKKEQNAELPMPVLEIYKYAQDHVLLMGKAGSGKSTALQQVLLNKAQEAQGNLEALIPVLVKLRSWQSFPSVIALIQDVLETGIQRQLDEKTIIDLLFAGRLLLLIDGVNELPSHFQDRNPSNDVETFHKKYRKTPMIFTTRVLGVSRNLGIAKQMEMLPLSDREMRQFIERCLPQQSEQMLNRLGNRLSRLGETPLLLSMLCDIARQREDGLPANLGSPFKAFADSYDHKIQENIPVDDKYKRWLPDLLQQIAFAMMPQNDPHGLRLEISKFEAENILAKFLDKEKLDKPRDYAKQWLENLLKYHLIQIKTDQIIEFRHQLIQEYYAAEYLRMRLEGLTDEKLQKSYLNYLDWTESLALMLELVEDSDRAVHIVQLALEVDLRLGARLAGVVKPEFQEKAVTLIVLLENEQKISQNVTIELLALTKSNTAVDFLIQVLKNANSSLGRIAADALAKIGNDKVVALLTKEFSNKESPVYKLADYALQKIYCYQFFEGSNILYFSEHSSTKDIIEGIGSDEDIDLLIQSLKDEDYYVRATSVQALGYTGNNKAIDPLIQALKDEDYDVRRNAAQALGRIGNNKAIDPLIQALKDEDSYVRGNTAEALGKIGNNKAVDSLIQALKDEDSYVRGNVVEALGKISNDKAIEPLIQSLTDHYFDVRRNAAQVLGRIGNDKAIDPLIQALKDEDYDVRRNAAQALGRIGNDKAIDPLIQALKDQYFDTRRKATEALEKIAKADRNLPILTQQLPHLFTLISTEASQEALSVITAIQARCKYYNYDIAQTPLPPEDKSSPTTGTTNIFNAPVGQVVGGNLIVQGDNIATQLVSRIFRHWLNVILEYFGSNGSRK